MNIVGVLRRNIGTIVTIIGFTLLCIITFGDLGEIATEEYWRNVRNNITSISFMTIGLSFIQVTIKQGLAEQSLQRGLNSENTRAKYDVHRNLIKSCCEREIYLPYFLQIYNKRHTNLRQRDFLVNNNFTTEKALYLSGKKKLIRAYRKIKTNITAVSIKWSTVKVERDKNGRIITLEEYRRARLMRSILLSMFSMIGTTFLVGGLFFTPNEQPLWQKFVKLFTYILTISFGSLFTVTKEYEKGAFGVPNELDEINQIWEEFRDWVIPKWVLTEVKKLNEDGGDKVNDEAEERSDSRTDLSQEQKEDESISGIGTDSVVPVSVCDPSDALLCITK